MLYNSFMVRALKIQYSFKEIRDDDVKETYCLWGDIPEDFP